MIFRIGSNLSKLVGPKQDSEDLAESPGCNPGVRSISVQLYSSRTDSIIRNGKYVSVQECRQQIVERVRKPHLRGPSFQRNPQGLQALAPVARGKARRAQRESEQKGRAFGIFVKHAPSFVI